MTTPLPDHAPSGHAPSGPAPSSGPAPRPWSAATRPRAARGPRPGPAPSSTPGGWCAAPTGPMWPRGWRCCKEYERALGYVGALLQAEPQNSQGLRLQRHIRARVRRDGLLGVAIVGGVVLGVAGLAGLLGLLISRGRH
ncbi:uncharacterized protein [Anser cygnoides]|uniref:uncharacterized protein isoform X2 n=1 Tax=Anser cygnoides TaxID=8845 RepID=UPI0034D280C1